MSYIKVIKRKFKTARSLGFIGSLHRIKSKCWVSSRFSIIHLVKNKYLLVDQVMHNAILFFYRFKIRRISASEQVFLIGRHDYGGVICTLHYARLWKRERGNIVIIIVTSHSHFAESLAKLLCPDVEIINLTKNYYIFLKPLTKHSLFHETVQSLCAFVMEQKGNPIFLWHNQPLAILHQYEFPSQYHPYFDKNLSFVEAKSMDFFKAYYHFRKQYCVKEECWKDYSNLLLKQGPIKKTNELMNLAKDLRNYFGMRHRYVILHLSGWITGESIVSDRRRVHDASRYNTLIDILIEKGFDVILHGRKEQPVFKARKHFFDYSKSAVCSPENDVALFSDAYFVISSKTGPDMLCQPFHVPLFGINYTERALLMPHVQYRYFFKHVKTKEGKYLSWKDLLHHPAFFEFGVDPFSKLTAELIYEEMSEEELVESLGEFLPLVDNPKEKWFEFSETQKVYLDALDPSHFDLYHSRSVPFNTYLKSEKSGV